MGPIGGSFTSNTRQGIATNLVVCSYSIINFIAILCLKVLANNEYDTHCSRTHL